MRQSAMKCQPAKDNSDKTECSSSRVSALTNGDRPKLVELRELVEVCRAADVRHGFLYTARNGREHCRERSGKGEESEKEKD